MKEEYDLSTMKSRANSYAKRGKKNQTYRQWILKQNETKIPKPLFANTSRAD